ncbi:hypothetical protein Mucpa_2173 [Mucilaginibacter paludis DSM 18603]|uniref:Uncharacterized protein n=1 Tax=Mucilaginibacter paludis DSM 18603 TaxID=714943 RepID=H1YG24_9SPHI|nr:hypothetical protein Mucpa_2173 [Mucilaginibacter paludis DSM 18603]
MGCADCQYAYFASTISILNLRHRPAQSPRKSLSLFVLIQKVTKKIKTARSFPPQGQTRPGVQSGPLPAFPCATDKITKVQTSSLFFPAERIEYAMTLGDQGKFFHNQLINKLLWRGDEAISMLYRANLQSGSASVRLLRSATA